MASSDSSERAFSSGGIAITKRCKGDIVEALEVLRSAIRNNSLKVLKSHFINYNWYYWKQRRQGHDLVRWQWRM